MNIRIYIAFAVSAVLIGWAFFIVSTKPSAEKEIDATPVVSFVDGNQIIDLVAKEGYSPRVIVAKAGVPTVLRVSTDRTFDCSASLVIPKLSYQKLLQSSGIEEITIPSDRAQGTIQGLCSMGMYGFQIQFQ